MKFCYHDAPFTHQFNFDIPEPAALHLAKKGLSEPVMVAAVQVSGEGIALRILGAGRFLFEPHAWPRFWQWLNGDRVPVFEAQAACMVCAFWLRWVEEKNAGRAAEFVRERNPWFWDMLQVAPGLENHPAVRDALADAALTDDPMPKKQRAPADGLLRLYEWATWYYMTDRSLAWVDACVLACDKHPALVPPSWGADERGETLARTVSRMLEKHPAKRQDRPQIHRWVKDT